MRWEVPGESRRVQVKLLGGFEGDVGQVRWILRNVQFCQIGIDGFVVDNLVSSFMLLSP